MSEQPQEWTVHEENGKWFLFMVDVGIPMTDELSARSVMTTHDAELDTERKLLDQVLIAEQKRHMKELEAEREKAVKVLIGLKDELRDKGHLGAGAIDKALDIFSDKTAGTRRKEDRE